MSENLAKPTTPGSVIQIDSLLMRTRWDNWVTDAGSIIEDVEIEGMPFMLLFDSAESTRYWFESDVEVGGHRG